jgi:hypothetical protein
LILLFSVVIVYEALSVLCHSKSIFSVFVYSQVDRDTVMDRLPVTGVLTNVISQDGEST